MMVPPLEPDEPCTTIAARPVVGPWRDNGGKPSQCRRAPETARARQGAEIDVLRAAEMEQLGGARQRLWRSA
jgi:hypothetical protein